MPSNNELKIALGEQFSLWIEIMDFVIENYSPAIEEWHVFVKNTAGDSE